MGQRGSLGPERSGRMLRYRSAAEVHTLIPKAPKPAYRCFLRYSRQAGATHTCLFSALKAASASGSLRKLTMA